MPCDFTVAFFPNTYVACLACALGVRFSASVANYRCDRLAKFIKVCGLAQESIKSAGILIVLIESCADECGETA